MRSDNLANPDAIDNNAVTLLNSGILKVDDIKNLYNKYSDNKTMKRMLSQYANTRANDERDNLKAQEWRSAVIDVDTVLTNWNSLVDAMITFSGNKRYKDCQLDGKYIPFDRESMKRDNLSRTAESLQNHIDDVGMINAVESF